jgi:hypothetical protein
VEIASRLPNIAGGALIVVALLGGCSSSGSGLGLDPDGEYFAGLDPATVNEVLSDPRRTDVLRNVTEAGEDRESLAQVMVLGNDFCRATYSFYLEWISTGVQPAYPEYSAPTYPGLNYDYFVTGTYNPTIEDIESGDPEVLRHRLAEIDGGCGQFAPVVVGDLDGPTVSEALGGLPRAEPWGNG